MKTSEAIDTLATALAKAQGELGGAKKDSTNPHYKSKYADLASVVDALKACFPKHGLSYVQTIVTLPDGVGVETRLMHASGQWIEGEPFALPVNKADAQGFGSCLTYARRYSLAAIAGVAPEDDDGNAAAAAKPGNGFGGSKPITATQEAHDAFSDLPDEVQSVVREWAMETIALVNEGKTADAAAFLAQKCETQEDKLAVWSQLPSNVRTKIKAEQRKHELATQA